MRTRYGPPCRAFSEYQKRMIRPFARISEGRRCEPIQRQHGGSCMSRGTRNEKARQAQAWWAFVWLPGSGRGLGRLARRAHAATVVLGLVARRAGDRIDAGHREEGGEQCGKDAFHTCSLGWRGCFESRRGVRGWSRGGGAGWVERGDARRPITLCRIR